MKMLPMKLLSTTEYKQAAELFTAGKIGVIPTDTIYGIHCSIGFPNQVEEIYKAKKRDTNKPCIILISSMNDLVKLHISLNEKLYNQLSKYWPGPYSIIFDCKNSDLAYLHRNTNTLAIRMPKKRELQKLLTITGPLISTSANIEGQPFSKNVQEAYKYFGDAVDFYLDEGVQNNPPSTVLKLNGDAIEILR